MKTHTVVSTLAAAMGLALAALPGQASAFTIPNYHVTQAQLDALHAGESRSDIIQALGKPESTPNWMDGSRSLVYEITDNVDGNQRVYVDLDSAGNMTAVEVLTP